MFLYLTIHHNSHPRQRPIARSRYLSASDEHGRLLIADDVAVKLGDKLRLIPGHCDPTVNMYDWIVGVRKGVVEEVWRVAGRGAR